MRGSTDTFDICGPLPTGTTVLEASAGTGKTFTIAALAVRYVAEGLARLDELMLVTFGRNATQELRERVRERLVSAERGLADPAHARAANDDLLNLLGDVPDDELARRRRRLATALADFDAATIATTHGFCLQMLTGLGVAGDFEPGATFVESVDDIVLEVVADLYLRKWGRSDSPPPQVSYQEALETVRKAIRDPHAVLEPSGADPDSAAGQRLALARAARAEVDARKRHRRVRDYDDLLTRLRDALVDPEGGAAARERVRSRYKVVLVDEFQDTDPVQWEILRLAFHQHTTLILIGDPKQAIYAFRGGDVVTYLEAAAQATSRSTLGRNWRSDKPLLEAFQAFFGEAALGDPGIVVRPVESAHPAPRLSGTTMAPLRLRVATREQFGVIPVDLPRVDPARELVARDLAGDVVRLLDSGALVATSGPARPVQPGDVAVLVRRNEDAVLVHDQLSAHNVPAVLTGLTNVFATAMASEWLVLLRALEQPNRARRVRTAALGCPTDEAAERLAAAGDAALDELGPLLQGWADVLSQRGVPALLEVAAEKADLFRRLLASPSGERQLTDLRQLGQLLHAAATREQLGTVALVEWLQHRIVDADADQTEERRRRLDSDAKAVQVITVHRSKGLEFPIVYVPYGWDRHVSMPPYPRFHTPAGVRSLDVGGRTGPDYPAHCALNAVEDAGESLRLLYVAVTRAQCQVVTWWVPTRNTESSPTHRLLFSGIAPGEEPPSTQAVPPDHDALSHLAELSGDSAGRIAVERAATADAVAWQPPRDAHRVLAVAEFTRRLDLSWRRTSYTALTSAAHDRERTRGGVRSEPEERYLDDEAETVSSPASEPGSSGTPVDDDALTEVLSPMRDLPRGTGFGVVVHSVLETVDTSAPDLSLELAERSRDVLGRRFGTPLDAETLGAALLPAMETPLGPLAGGRRLRDVMPSDRLAELDFELPLTGGDTRAGRSATLGAFADVLRGHLAPDDPFAPYPDVLAGRDFRHERLRGYLVGSLDAVLRLPIEDGGQRYLVVDYKTNWLGGASTYDGPLTAWHYRRSALEEAMLAAHYPLQLLLYLVALHRFLRWRQPGYDPDVHLGGGLYLFLRGMCGADNRDADGAPCGVFGWQPPRGLVADLSHLLAGGPNS